MRPALLALALAAASASVACRRDSSSTDAGAVLPAEVRGRVRTHRVQDVTLHTVEVGEERGPLRLVVHGGPGLDHTYLRPWLDALGERARLVYVDLRGHGRSSAPADANGYTLSAAAADLAALIQTLGDGAPADVIGHAFGTAVVLELAVRHPERVGRLVLIDPLRDTGQIRSMPTRSRETLGDAGWEQVLALSTPQGTLRDRRDTTELFRRLGRMWWHRPPADAVLSRMGRDMLYRPEADEHFLVALQGWNAALRAREVRAQVLVLSGAEDRTFPAADSRRLSEALPHGRYAEIAAAGHCPFIEQPARFIPVVQDFLNGDARRE